MCLLFTFNYCGSLISITVCRLCVSFEWKLCECELYCVTSDPINRRGSDFKPVQFFESFHFQVNNITRTWMFVIICVLSLNIKRIINYCYNSFWDFDTVHDFMFLTRRVYRVKIIEISQIQWKYFRFLTSSYKSLWFIETIYKFYIFIGTINLIMHIKYKYLFNVT